MMVGRLVSFFVLGPGNLSAGVRAATLGSCIRIWVFSWGNPFRDYSSPIVMVQWKIASNCKVTTIGRGPICH